MSEAELRTFFAHSSASIDPGARVGAATKIWHFCHVSGGASIGQGCTLGQNVYVADHVEIGDRVKIQNNVSVYSGVVLEDEVFCGPSMVFTNVELPRAGFPQPPAAYVPTRVRQGASIGANATIICGVTIGKWAFVAAGSVVTRNVPDYGFVLGVPARLDGWVCQCGVRLGFAGADAVCVACARGYTLSQTQQVELVTLPVPGGA